LTGALLLPGLALSGFAGVGKQIALWSKDEAWRAAALASFRIGDNVKALVDFVYGTMDYIVAGTIIVIVLLLAGRWLRSQCPINELLLFEPDRRALHPPGRY
jgi:hypothetical protein